MGADFDLTGSYRVPLMALLAATVIALVPMTRLGPYRYRGSEPEERDQIVSIEAGGTQLAARQKNPPVAALEPAC